MTDLVNLFGANLDSSKAVATPAPASPAPASLILSLSHPIFLSFLLLAYLSFSPIFFSPIFFSPVFLSPTFLSYCSHHLSISPRISLILFLLTSLPLAALRWLSTGGGRRATARDTSPVGSAREVQQGLFVSSKSSMINKQGTHLWLNSKKCRFAELAAVVSLRMPHSQHTQRRSLSQRLVTHTQRFSLSQRLSLSHRLLYS